VKKLYIALDGGRKLNVGSLQSFEKKEFLLRTIDINQFQAKVTIGLSQEDQDEILHSTFIQNLKAADNGYSYLHCQLKKQGRRLYLVVKNERKIVSNESFSLVPPSVGKRRTLWGAGLLTILLFLALFFSFFDFSKISNDKTDKNTSLFTPSTGSMVSDNKSTLSTGSLVTDKKPTPSNSPKPDINKTVTPTKSSLPNEEESTPAVESSLTNDSKALLSNKSTLSENNEEKQQVPEGNLIEEKESVTVQTVQEKEIPKLSLKERTLNFTPNSTVLNREAVRVLEIILPILLENPELNVIISGHCAIAGTEVGRQEISVQRAENTYAWLKKKGWNPSSQPQIRGEAGNYPLTMDPEKQDINRRVEIDYSN
jgi:outer membrane protein OmpA-like peptidoglycan-associated protein